jgi:O-antigen/teichoic acid export membrane protein
MVWAMPAEVPAAPGVDRARAARSTMWSAVENGGLALISFSSLIVYARYLSAAEFGLFSIVLALVELLDVLVNMLFHDVLVQKREVTPLHFDTAFTSTMVLSLALFGTCWALAPTFAGLVHNSHAAGILAWTALRFPCSALGAIIVAQQRRDLAFQVLAFRSLLGRISGAVLGIGLVALGAGIWGLVAQQLLIALIGSVVLWLSANRRPRVRFSSRAFRDLIGFGASAMGALFLSFGVRRVFTIVAGVRLGNEAAGFLNIGFRAVDVLWAIASTAVSQVALPVLARLQTEPERIKSAYRSAIELICFVLYPCFVGIALVAPEVVELLFGVRWLPSSPYVTTLALLTVAQAPRLLITPTLTAVGRPREPMIGIAVELAVMLGLLFTLGSPVLSLTAAVGIWIAREFVSAPIMTGLLARATGISVVEQLSRILHPLMASTAMGLSLLGMRHLLPLGWGAVARFAVLVPVGAAVFLVSAWSLDPAPLRRLLGFAASVAARTRTPSGPRPAMEAK